LYFLAILDVGVLSPHPEPTLDYAVKELNPMKNDREKRPSRDEIREAAKSVKRLKTETDGRSSKSSNKEEKLRDDKGLLSRVSP